MTYGKRDKTSRTIGWIALGIALFLVYAILHLLIWTDFHKAIIAKLISELLVQAAPLAGLAIRNLGNHDL